MTVFEDHNYRIAGSAEEEIGMYYVSPSQMTRFGGVMPIQERLELVGRAEKEHFLIIEDDYNSEFKYFQKPVPSLQDFGRKKCHLSGNIFQNAASVYQDQLYDTAAGTDGNLRKKEKIITIRLHPRPSRSH